MPLKKLLGAALLAGVFAALVTASFHWFLTEPLIDRAIEIESESASHAEEPVVGRPMQKFGLVVGFLLYGLAWGTLFGTLVYALGERAAARRYFLLALALGWSVAVFPQLKYPANPPGVGEAATIGYRQELFLIAIALALIGMIAAVAAQKRARRRAGTAAVAAAYIVYLAVVYAALPENPDPVKLDAGLVQSFRLLSLAGHIVFWSALGAAFAWLLRPQAAPT